MSLSQNSGSLAALSMPPEVANGLLEARGEEGAATSTQERVPSAPIKIPQQSQTKLGVESAYSDLDDGDLVLEDLHNDLAYLRSRAVVVCRQIDQVIARNAPMNKLPIEVRMCCGFVDSWPASIRICADSRKRSFSRACSSWAHTTTSFSRLPWMRYAGLGIV